MTPVGSRPKIAGSGGNSFGSTDILPKKLLITRCRFGTMPQAFTSTSTSVERGSGMGIRSSRIGSPYLWTRAAIIVVMGMKFSI